MTGKTWKRNLCNEELTSCHSLNVHNEDQHEGVSDRKKKNFKCNVCGYESSNQGHFIAHTRTHTGERPFKCKVTACGMAFKQESNLRDHIKYKHSDERPFKCDFLGCLHTTKTSSDLTKHKKVHSAERPFACSKCDYKTSLNGNLKLHMRHHSARRDFKCNHPRCTESFKSLAALRSHFSNQHEDRTIECDHSGCGRKFANTEALKKHKRNIHAKKIHACPRLSCSYITNAKWKLADHMITHEVKQEKILCPMEGCEYKGKNSRALKFHMRRHETLLLCSTPGCGEYAHTEDALKDHVELHNPLGRPFHCPLCFKHFATLERLQRHCFVHTNEKPFKCGYCEYATARQAHVKSHVSLVHANMDFPFIIHLLDDRECLRCKVILSSAEFLLHCKGHEGSVVNM